MVDYVNTLSKFGTKLADRNQRTKFNHLKTRYRVTFEGFAAPIGGENITMDIRGRNLVTGLPKVVTVASDETEEALREVTAQIVDAVHSVLEKTPPELAADIADRGIVLTGGGALLHGLEDLIEENTGITTMTAEEQLTEVSIGTGKRIEFLN